MRVDPGSGDDPGLALVSDSAAPGWPSACRRIRIGLRLASGERAPSFHQLAPHLESLACQIFLRDRLAAIVRFIDLVQIVRQATINSDLVKLSLR